MEKIRKELLEIPESYPQDHLHITYYSILDETCRGKLERELLRFVSLLRAGGTVLSPDEKVRLIYDVLSRCLTYDHSEDPPDGMDLRFCYAGGILKGKAVCMGIAELFTLLGRALDLEIRTVIGYGGDPAHEGGLHAWNMVWLPQGQEMVPYHCDLTWDLGAIGGLMGYRFYLKSDAYMRSHDHYWLAERYPACPGNRPIRQIPSIQPKAIRFLCGRFQMMRKTQ